MYFLSMNKDTDCNEPCVTNNIHLLALTKLDLNVSIGTLGKNSWNFFFAFLTPHFK